MSRHAALVWIALLLACACAANIDKDGFVQDGKTTYCQAVSTEQHVLQFLSLSTSSAGECPLAMELTTQVKSYSMAETTFIVSWTATVEEASDSLFPRVLNSSSGLPNAVVGAELRACRVGSNCESENDVYTPTVIGDDTTIGVFDSTGFKSLSSWRLTLPQGNEFVLPQGNEFVLVGKITLLGETTPTDFVVFQRVNVGAGVSDPLGTVQPNDVSASEQSSSADGKRPAMGGVARDSLTTSDEANFAPSPSVEVQSDGSNGVTSSSTANTTSTADSGGFPIGPIVGIIGAAAVVVAVVMVRGKRAAEKAGDHFVKPTDVDHEPRKHSQHQANHQPEPEIQVSPAMLESFTRGSAARSDKRYSTNTDDLEFALGSHEQIVIMGESGHNLNASGHSAAGAKR